MATHNELMAITDEAFQAMSDNERRVILEQLNVESCKLSGPLKEVTALRGVVDRRLVELHRINDRIWAEWAAQEPKKFETTNRMVMCVSDWPEGGEDFRVFRVRVGETDEQAIERAKRAYSATDHSFYIADLQEDK